jgi:hypothetical protein
MTPATVPERYRKACASPLCLQKPFDSANCAQKAACGVRALT